MVLLVCIINVLGWLVVCVCVQTRSALTCALVAILHHTHVVSPPPLPPFRPESVIGVLEYDPDVAARPQHREFLENKVVFKTAVPFSDPALVEKIHQTFRITFIKDVVLPRVLDDAVRHPRVVPRCLCVVIFGFWFFPEPLSAVLALLPPPLRACSCRGGGRSLSFVCADQAGDGGCWVYACCISLVVEHCHPCPHSSPFLPSCMINPLTICHPTPPPHHPLFRHAWQTFAALNSIIFFNNVDILAAIQEDADYLDAVFARLQAEDAAADAVGDLVMFLQELCNMTKALNVQRKVAFYGELISRVRVQTLAFFFFELFCSNLCGFGCGLVGTPPSPFVSVSSVVVVWRSPPPRVSLFFSGVLCGGCSQNRPPEL